jgi:signal transduction histidine kinase
MLTGKSRLHLDAVDLAGVVQSALEDARPAAVKKRIELVSSLEAVERVQSDAARLQQILGNLLPRVFERFWQAERLAAMESAGLGLGLAIADQLARLQGGEIRAASPGIGQGASFTLTLPLNATVEQRRGA